jgi:Fe-S cluster biogenesis protein NfuA
MFVQTQLTPNENAIKFILNYKVYSGEVVEVSFEQWEKHNQKIIDSMKNDSSLKKIEQEIKIEKKEDGCCQEDGVEKKEGCCQEETKSDDILDNRLIQDLFITNDVERVMIGEDYLVITKKKDVEWSIIKPEILSRIMDSHLSGEIISGLKNEESNDYVSMDFSTEETDMSNETIKLINELIDERVKPAVAMDGGDIQFCGYRNNIVYVKMKGACSGCPSSSATLKGGVENMLKYYVPEIIAVESVG